MARLYSNENFPARTVDALRKLGHDVLTSFESGKANQSIPDKEVLAFAAGTGRIVLTLNRRHFVRLHMENPDHAGIIVCTEDADFMALAQRIHRALQAQPNMKSQLVRVNRPGN